MKLAKFVNFTDEIFAHPSLGGHDELCQWGKEPYCFPAKSSKTMEDWKAAFFAKHLTNRELLKVPGGEYHTSPKMRNGMFYAEGDDPQFMEIFNKCYIVVGSEDMSEEKMKDSLIDKAIADKEAEVKTSVFCTQCDAKGPIKHKSTCPTVMAKKTAESDFEGLDAK